MSCSHVRGDTDAVQSDKERDVTRRDSGPWHWSLVTDPAGRGPWPALGSCLCVHPISVSLARRLSDQLESSKGPGCPIRAEIRDVAVTPSGSVMYRTWV